jgi:hypothetical protein
MNALVDNDIVFKAVCYGLLAEVLTTLCSHDDRVGILGAAKFVVSKRIQMATVNKGREVALANLEEFLCRALAIEPTEVERNIAADIEAAAQSAGFSLDAGESQLCAVLVQRMVPWLLTGDKRAIRAMEQLLDADARLAAITGRVKCLEQLVLAAIPNDLRARAIREKICVEAHIDKTLAICFSCCSASQVGDYTRGLESYIDDLRKDARRVLSP